MADIERFGLEQELESSEDKLNRVSEIVNELEATVEASNERKRLEKEVRSPSLISTGQSS